MSLLRPINFDCRLPQIKQSFSARKRQTSCASKAMQQMNSVSAELPVTYSKRN